jgi:hypothetical protein
MAVGLFARQLPVRRRLQAIIGNAGTHIAF